ncbi:hypothetical protein ACWIG3_23965 [Streptomyces celluloflavus]|uniref:hypothetical protein n=1 Tax=Streptomyces TaxID=1883 RepID=UPI00069BF08E|nr:MULTISPECIES: hypothetical protein [Streptomyces]MYU54687.1 hypothetical protein [Streptomyces sp. SID7805]
MFAKLSDRLVALVVPEVEAAAASCSEARNYCDGECPFWWWRRAHYITCSDGKSWTEYECCGCGC